MVAQLRHRRHAQVLEEVLERFHSVRIQSLTA
jgi:hypothetical protein